MQSKDVIHGPPYKDGHEKPSFSTWGKIERISYPLPCPKLVRSIPPEVVPKLWKTEWGQCSFRASIHPTPPMGLTIKLLDVEAWCLHTSFPLIFDILLGNFISYLWSVMFWKWWSCFIALNHGWNETIWCPRSCVFVEKHNDETSDSGVQFVWTCLPWKCLRSSLPVAQTRLPLSRVPFRGLAQFSDETCACKRLVVKIDIKIKFHIKSVVELLLKLLVSNEKWCPIYALSTTPSYALHYEIFYNFGIFSNVLYANWYSFS